MSSSLKVMGPPVSPHNLEERLVLLTVLKLLKAGQLLLLYIT